MGLQCDCIVLYNNIVIHFDTSAAVIGSITVTMPSTKGADILRKQRIYLDSSAISHLYQLDAPTKMDDTLLFWEELRQGRYEVFIGTVAFIEIDGCNEHNRKILDNYLAEIDFTLVENNPSILLLADKIIEQGVLTKKSYNDCNHIASAVISECDIIVSWNFKHMVNVKTINGVRGINMLNGYKSVDIYTPSMLIERSDERYD